MKFRLFALICILTLSLVGWAQETPAVGGTELDAQPRKPRGAAITTWPT